MLVVGSEIGRKKVVRGAVLGGGGGLKAIVVFTLEQHKVLETL